MSTAFHYAKIAPGGDAVRFSYSTTEVGGPTPYTPSVPMVFPAAGGYDQALQALAAAVDAQAATHFGVGPGLVAGMAIPLGPPAALRDRTLTLGVLQGAGDGAGGKSGHQWLVDVYGCSAAEFSGQPQLRVELLGGATFTMSGGVSSALPVPRREASQVSWVDRGVLSARGLAPGVGVGQAPAVVEFGDLSPFRGLLVVGRYVYNDTTLGDTLGLGDDELAVYIRRGT